MRQELTKYASDGEHLIISYQGIVHWDSDDDGIESSMDTGNLVLEAEGTPQQVVGSTRKGPIYDFVKLR